MANFTAANKASALRGAVELFSDLQKGVHIPPPPAGPPVGPENVGVLPGADAGEVNIFRQHATMDQGEVYGGPEVQEVVLRVRPAENGGQFFFRIIPRPFPESAGNFFFRIIPLRTPEAAMTSSVTS